MAVSGNVNIWWKRITFSSRAQPGSPHRFTQCLRGEITSCVS